jgi:hypothetical protein
MTWSRRRPPRPAREAHPSRCASFLGDGGDDDSPRVSSVAAVSHSLLEGRVCVRHALGNADTTWSPRTVQSPGYEQVVQVSAGHAAPASFTRRTGTRSRRLSVAVAVNSRHTRSETRSSPGRMVSVCMLPRANEFKHFIPVQIQWISIPSPRV